MYAAVAEPTDSHPRLQFLLTEMPSEMRPAMYLFGNQVMKGERHDAPATCALPRDFVRGLYDAGNAASIADLISSPSGLALLGKWPTMSPEEDTTYLLKFQRG